MFVGSFPRFETTAIRTRHNGDSHAAFLDVEHGVHLGLLGRK
jgi:hypothetical protein